ncbi:MAG: VWA domain-containing protein [Spirochaetales bacterium]|nr:VWA domain-containing protein [Spirochaetales bacterium]MCF7938147.1 VWA domain-containing protein [Spirochaetales bacterium]
MTLQYPRALYLLLLILPVVLIFFLNYRRGLRDLSLLAGKERSRTVQAVFLVKWFFRLLVLTLFIAAMSLALAGVQWGKRSVPENRRGYELIFAVDISRSMLAEDISPSRLERSGELIRRLIDTFPGSRYALVAFKGEAVTLVPAGENSEALLGFLDLLAPALLTAPGTNLEAGLREACDAFVSKDLRFRTVVLFSDGESLSGDLAAAAGAVQEAGAKVIAVGTGTKSGARIPLSDGRFVLDEAGNPVISRLDEQALSRVAEMTGGSYYSVDKPGLIEQVEEGLRSKVERNIREGIRIEDVNRYRFFLVIGLGMFMIYMIIRIFRWRDML